MEDINMVRNEVPKAGEFYKHFKNRLYQIITVAEHTETQEKLVIYQALYGDFSIYARPLEMFMSEVDHEKYPHVAQKYRFTKVKFITKEEENIQSKKEEKIAQKEEKIVQKEEKIAQKEEMILEKEKKKPLKKEYSKEELFYQFLDAETYQEKLEIFFEMKNKLDDKILTNIAVSLDLVLEEEDLEKRYIMIRQNLETYAKFECNRLR